MQKDIMSRFTKLIALDKNPTILPEVSRWMLCIRGLAATYVVIAHLYQVFYARFWGPDALIIKLINFVGTIGIQLFFVMSGYVITHSLLTNLLRNGKLDIKDYTLKRLTRIYPPFTVVLAFCWLLAPLIMLISPSSSITFGQPADLYVIRHALDNDIQQFIANFLMLNTILLPIETIPHNGPLWSLAIETWCYIAAMLSAMILSGLYRKTSIIVLSAIILFQLNQRNIDFLAYLLWFSFGSFIYFLEHSTFTFRISARPLVAGACISITVLILSVNPQLVLKNGTLSCHALQLFIVSSFILCLLANFRHPPDCLSGFEALGKFSLTLYIFHFPILLLSYQITLHYIGDERYYLYTAASAASFIVIIMATLFIAPFLENQRFFLNILRGTDYKTPQKH